MTTGCSSRGSERSSKVRIAASWTMRQVEVAADFEAGRKIRLTTEELANFCTPEQRHVS